MRLIAALALCAAALAAHAGEERDQGCYRYKVHIIGAPDDVVSSANTVSSNGKYVAGQAWHTPSWSYQAAVYRGDSRRTFILPGGGYSNASSVNARGEVVGDFWNQADGPWLTSRRAFHWKQDVLTPLPSLGGGSTVATAINNSGTVAGWSHARDGAQHAFVYRNGYLMDLGTWGGVGAEAHGINDSGDVAGVRYHASEPAQEAVRIVRGQAEPLGRFFPGLNSMATSINQRGDAVGIAFKTFNEAELPMTWAFAVLGNRMVQLTTSAPGWGGSALSVNAARQVVGTYNKLPQGGGAFLWENGKLIDLSSLPEVKAAGWAWLSTAVEINDEGVIVGSGDTVDGRTRGFMLVPLRGK